MIVQTLNIPILTLALPTARHTEAYLAGTVNTEGWWFWDRAWLISTREMKKNISYLITESICSVVWKPSVLFWFGQMCEALWLGGRFVNRHQSYPKAYMKEGWGGDLQHMLSKNKIKKRKTHWKDLSGPWGQRRGEFSSFVDITVKKFTTTLQGIKLGWFLL